MSALDDLNAALAGAPPLDPNAPGVAPPPPGASQPTLAPAAPPSSPLNDLTNALKTAPPLLAGGDSPSGSAGAPDLSSYAGNKILQYGSDILHGRVALNTLQNLFGQNTYDPNRSFAANATDPRAVQQAVGIGMAVNPANIASTTVPAPSAPQLRDTANTQYNNFRGANLQVTGTGVVNAVNNLRSDLAAAGFGRGGPNDQLFNVIDNLGNSQSGSYIISPGVYDGAGLDRARQKFSELAQAGGPQAKAAGMARDAIDNYIDGIPTNPQFLAPGNTANPADAVQNLQDARANYGAARRSNALTGDLSQANVGILDRSLARADSSPTINLDNQIRSRLTTFLQTPSNLAGYTPEQIEMLRQVAAGGSWLNKSLQGLGSSLSSHEVTGGAAVAAAEAIMAHGADYKTALMALAPSMVGRTLKAAGSRMTANDLGAVDTSVRANSPLGQQMQQANQFQLPAWYSPAPALANAPWRWPASLLSQGAGP